VKDLTEAAGRKRRSSMTTPAETARALNPPMDRPDALYEFVDGEWRETPPMGAAASFLASYLDRRLGYFAEEKGLGVSMVETLFRLAPEGPARRPDVAFVAYDRWPFTEPFEEDPPVFDIVPNLAVEVNSPSNTLDEMLDKNRDYFFAGVQQVWVILPRQRQVYVYDAPDQVRILTEKHELEGGSVVPGFRLSLTQMFAAPVRPTSPPPSGR
jgi:Uma2 family endonuclease